MAKEKKVAKISGPLLHDEVSRKPPKVKLENLRDAVVDGKVMFVENDELILRRDHLNDKKLYLCTVTKIHENGDVQLRNVTLLQDFIFNIKNPPTLKLPPKTVEN